MKKQKTRRIIDSTGFLDTTERWRITFWCGCRNKIIQGEPFKIKILAAPPFLHAPKNAPNFREHFGSIASSSSTSKPIERGTHGDAWPMNAIVPCCTTLDE
ncbi:hypothetical protein [Burkholderia sp. L27(2015)]|uniref:hypothetical protein n=1 Tax=Burkholderia sp. L27(2015) TaxID=1641858 RepID=UPI00131CDA71|nr:hypothetical protein [Burkholderia sp. L27(2015)]